ncbi:histidinol-phosphatase HisJ family protein [Candidatus Thorarchaeota archaeon]|nr:MAG: histidinol-phosphatase HisJ family protein [Candidatus Thorarchaeota archaeon]
MQGAALLIDYHIHPDYSLDAQGTLTEFCQAAVKRGISEIAFTTHVDTDPVTDDCFVVVNGEKVNVHSGDWLADYEASVLQVANRYQEEGLVVRLGAEIDLHPEVGANLPDNFYDTDFDLIIGSVHLIDHLAISTEEGAKVIFSRYSPSELADIYFPMLLDALNERLIDIVGHLDIYRRYGRNYYGEEIGLIWQPYLLELVNKMKKQNLGFEVNTSTWRKGMEQPMPSATITKELVESGVDVVTTGSDAHRPQDVGYGIEKAERMIQSFGVDSPARFASRKIL